MTKIAFNKFEEILQLPKSVSITDFKQFISEYLERKLDKRTAIQELDNHIAILQNHILSLSLFVKQNHLLLENVDNFCTETDYYTKQEVAIKYRVSIRTVSNWISDGLEAIEIGGIRRISRQAIEAFKKSAKGKKFKWRSIVRSI